MRIGIGFDVHAFAVGRPLVIGGIRIPYELGLAGHSDADVLSHAIADALLGAAGQRDIGCLFPDTSPETAGICSLLILRRVSSVIRAAGYSIGNVDSVVVAQRPRLSGHIDEMRKAIADALGIAAERVMVKATTTERLGFAGREEGIAAQAVCVLEAGSALPQTEGCSG